MFEFSNKQAFLKSGTLCTKGYSTRTAYCNDNGHTIIMAKHRRYRREKASLEKITSRY